MSKNSRNSPEQEGEISVSMVKFTMKGSDASLQKGLDTIKAALAQAGFAAIPEIKHLRATPPKQSSTLSEDEIDITELSEELTDTEDLAPVPSPRPKKPLGPKKAPNYKIIKDLKLEDVSPTLKDFVADKEPKTDLNKYLCIAYWFKHHKDIEDLTTEHFFTAYMTYNWPLPSDAGTPIRDLRHAKRQWFASGATQGTSTITNAGERRVQEMGKVES